MNAPNVPKLGSAYRTVRRNEGWQEQARCATEYGPSFDREPIAVQRATCVACGVRANCLDYALRTEQSYKNGDRTQTPVYGALTSPERMELRTEINTTVAYIDGLPVGERLRALDAIIGYFVLETSPGTLTAACQLAREAVAP